MNIKHFYDKPLAHGSYAIESEGQIALVDPGRDPQPYIEFSKEHHGKIIAVFETHPHADFASSHLEFKKRFGADIYVNPKVGATYDFKPMEHNDEVKIGKLSIKALFTPGHSPDHNAYLLVDEEGKEKAVFTGDALFVGDVGRPDLREGVGNIKISKKELAAMMFHTLQTVFSNLPNEVIVYPAHGAGSLCGKSMSTDLNSTIGREKKENWAFQISDKGSFTEAYLEGHSFIPKYFPFEVERNRKGFETLEENLQKVPSATGEALDGQVLIIDVRDQETFKKGHLQAAINLQDQKDAKFETWLGAIVAPEEKFYMVAESNTALESAIRRVAKIGYEENIKGKLVNPTERLVKEDRLDLAHFKSNPDQYTIIDIRNKPEVGEGQYFKNAINIPLHELRERTGEIKGDKPVVVHCAGGYRSAAGASILAHKLKGKVYDLSDAIKEFKKIE